MRRRQFGDDGIKFDAGKGANGPRRRLAVAAGQHCGVLGHVAPPNRRLQRLPQGLDTSVADSGRLLGNHRANLTKIDQRRPRRSNSRYPMPAGAPRREERLDRGSIERADFNARGPHPPAKLPQHHHHPASRLRRIARLQQPPAVAPHKRGKLPILPARTRHRHSSLAEAKPRRSSPHGDGTMPIRASLPTTRTSAKRSVRPGPGDDVGIVAISAQVDDGQRDERQPRRSYACAHAGRGACWRPAHQRRAGGRAVSPSAAGSSGEGEVEGVLRRRPGIVRTAQIRDLERRAPAPSSLGRCAALRLRCREDPGSEPSRLRAQRRFASRAADRSPDGRKQVLTSARAPWPSCPAQPDLGFN